MLKQKILSFNYSFYSKLHIAPVELVVDANSYESLLEIHF